MNKFSLFYILFLASIFSSCASDSPTGPELWKPDPIQEIASYTASDVTLAYNAFNSQFYNPEKKLYYSTTKKEGLGSIWTQAIFWDIAMDSYKRTNDIKDLDLVNDIYKGGHDEYDAYNFDNTVKWFIYDDIMWWVISLSRAYQITGNQTYLDNSITGFKRVWQGSYDTSNGGMFWDFKHSGKNACINYPTVIAAANLYTITKDQSYLDKAKEIYTWSRKNLFQKGTGRVADNRVGNNIGYSDYTYNQGTCIGAAMALYKITNDQSYLDDAKMAADYTKNTMSNEEGILPAEGDWNEQGVLKAIFARYLMDLVTIGKQDQYLAWIRKNGNVAWSNRDKFRNIMFRDYDIPCPLTEIQSFEACSAVAIMQIVPSEK